MDTTRYGVQTRSTEESLGCRWEHVIKYGENVILAGHYWNGPGCPDYFAAVYTYLDDEKQDADDDMELEWLSGLQYEDPGHAIKAAIEYIED